MKLAKKVRAIKKIPLYAKLVAYGLVTIIVIQFAGLLALGIAVRGLADNDTRMNQQVAVLTAAATSTNQARPVVISPKEDLIYLSGLRLQLPLNGLTSSLQYSLRDGQEADITTNDLSSYIPMKLQAIGCSSAVRLKIEAAPNPYNPHEKPLTPVKLDDGRTLQIYVFSHPDCQQAFLYTRTDPAAIGAAFKQAQSY